MKERVCNQATLHPSLLARRYKAGHVARSSGGMGGFEPPPLAQMIVAPPIVALSQAGTCFNPAPTFSWRVF